MDSTDTNPYQSSAIDEPTSSPGVNLRRGLAGLCISGAIGFVVGGVGAKILMTAFGEDQSAWPAAVGIASVFGLAAFATYTGAPPRDLGRSLLVVAVIWLVSASGGSLAATAIGYEPQRTYFDGHEHRQASTLITAILVLVGTLIWTRWLCSREQSENAAADRGGTS